MFVRGAYELLGEPVAFFFLVEVPKLPWLELYGLRLSFTFVCLYGWEQSKMCTSNAGLFVQLLGSLMCKRRENLSFDNDVAMNRPTTRFHAIESNVNVI